MSSSDPEPDKRVKTAAAEAAASTGAAQGTNTILSLPCEVHDHISAYLRRREKLRLARTAKGLTKPYGGRFSKLVGRDFKDRKQPDAFGRLLRRQDALVGLWAEGSKSCRLRRRPSRRA